jgi:hypothetical protein
MLKYTKCLATRNAGASEAPLENRPAAPGRLTSPNRQNCKNFFTNRVLDSRESIQYISSVLAAKPH